MKPVRHVITRLIPHLPSIFVVSPPQRIMRATMANHNAKTVALSCSNVVFAAISGALAGFGMLVVLNIATTVGQGTGYFSSV